MALPSVTARRQAARLFGVGLMLSLWLLLVGLASSDALHQLLHADSHSPSHECVVKSFAQGSFIKPAVLAVPLAVPNFLEQPAPVVPSLCSHIDWRLAPSRAPPLGS